MRVIVTSRIFSPEPAAASFRLAALSDALDEAGHEVEVLTSIAPDGGEASTRLSVIVKRNRVLRDKDGYVRGYLQYMSFDIPLAFRLLCARRPDLIVTEPPPTTGAVVRVIAFLRRVPYAYYAADVWSDAAAAAGAPRLVVRVVRALELWALRGAAKVLSVSDGVTHRLTELKAADRVETIGNGIDLVAFAPDGPKQLLHGPYLLYAGTASEVHGAIIFVRAFKQVLAQNPNATLVYLGQGSEREEIERHAQTLPRGSVQFLPRVDPEGVSTWLRGAAASLASVRPGQGYDFAFPTKMYASVACGTPVIYAGLGPGREFAGTPPLGVAVDYDVDAVAHAMVEALKAQPESRRREISSWAADTLSLQSIARRGAQSLGTQFGPGVKAHG